MGFSKIAGAIVLAVASWQGPVLAADYADQKVVYHNDGPSKVEYYRHMLANVRNHINAVGVDHVRIAVVDNGDGLDLFEQAQSDPDLATRVDDLRASGVKFLICDNTLKSRHIDWHDLYGVTEADIVPSGVAEIARLQQQGYSYIHP